MQNICHISLITLRLTVVCLSIWFAIGVACSSSNFEPTEEGLIQRSEIANDALNNQHWAAIYQLYPPNVHEICSLSDFEDGWNANYEEQYAALQELFGVASGLTLVVETNSVAITGTDAYVPLELDAFTSDGQHVIENLVNDSAQAWIFKDGEWFIGEDIPDEFC